MDRSNEREMFLKYLADIYLQNPNLPISYQTIYHELSRFILDDNNNRQTIGNDSLLAVQLSLNNIFRYNDKVNTFSYNNGYFWAIENRMGKTDTEFYSDMETAIKVYVSVDMENIHKISEMLFNYMIKEGIVMQCKIAKEMRNDALVCRVRTKEDAIKVSNYINSLEYKSRVKPNPFLLNDGKVSMAMDGSLSYNSILSKLLCKYLDMKRQSNSLDKVNLFDFGNFVKDQIGILNGPQKEYFCHLYEITNEKKYSDFIMICSLISKNIDDSLSKEELFLYQDFGDIKVADEKKQYSKQEEDKILYVINSLTNYYSLSDVHKIIMRFIDTGDYRLFTRKDDIRTVVMENFTSFDVKNIISDLGWRTFVAASRVTYDKYGYDWLFAAISQYLKEETLKGFARDGDVRSRLGLIIPSSLLREVINDKLSEKEIKANPLLIIDLVMEEIEKEENKKVNGRK